MYPKTHELQMVEVDTSTGTLLVPYEIKRSKRARYIRITLGQYNHARVSVPWHCPFKDAMAFLKSQGDWLEKNLKSNPTRASLYDYLERNPRIYGMGHTFRVHINSTQHKPFIVYSINQGQAELRIRPEKSVDQELLALLREFAADVLVQRTREFADKFGLDLKRVTTRNQSSRWGSCSSQGNVSLNWRLVLLRPHLQDHIILHELAHLTEMNHSERFWKLLESYDPRAKQHNSQLDTAAAKLMPLGYK